jgi:hypothetical protein
LRMIMTDSREKITILIDKVKHDYKYEINKHA